MTEDELQAGITEALTICGWRWMHIRRSDGITMGAEGWPDIYAVHPGRPGAPILAWELKGDGGRPTGDQVAWIAAIHASPAGLAGYIDARFLYPTDYDRAINLILGRSATFE